MDPRSATCSAATFMCATARSSRSGAISTAPGAQAIDGRGMIALPGLIDTHNHLWNSTCRNHRAWRGRSKATSRTVLALGKQYTPEDTYHGVRLGCAELIHSGVTTVHCWAHNIRSPAHADADVRALTTPAFAGRFSYGTYQGGPPPDDTMDIADLERLHGEWHEHANEGLLTLGMASRSVSTSASRPAISHAEVAHAIGRPRKSPQAADHAFTPAAEESSRCWNAKECSAPMCSSSTPVQLGRRRP